MINYSGTPILETERLILRKVEHKDSQSIFNNWLSDDRVMDNLIKGAHKSIEETIERVNEIVKNYTSKEFCYWGIELKSTSELIGAIDFYNFDNATENCEVGYCLGYNWWNQGYGTEALKAVLEYGFRQMNIHKISAAHNTDNPASGKILEKVRMNKEGIIRHMIRNSKNQYKDCAIYGMLQDDYLN
ncbi:GNAT family N-acetyltransferase [Bacillus sp. AFS041924]|uniref:GNAT family N-acetyltransferase n=1 Tax=Bacillus sp. AFS041924 TaxID=2033503 RepID=UPI000BFCADD8|nr:GNAT family N-acetyltransferase [Bacillus sp. AFS041924]PGS48737.1 GNAT family N-acetyltransferase [Bacillus sp. AFS041924]